MIGQVVLSCLNRNSHIFIQIDRSIYEKKQKYLVRIYKTSKRLKNYVDIENQRIIQTERRLPPGFYSD
jgi:hypothetical protein